MITIKKLQLVICTDQILIGWEITGFRNYSLQPLSPLAVWSENAGSLEASEGYKFPMRGSSKPSLFFWQTQTSSPMPAGPVCHFSRFTARHIYASLEFISLDLFSAFSVRIQGLFPRHSSHCTCLLEQICKVGQKSIRELRVQAGIWTQNSLI